MSEMPKRMTCEVCGVGLPTALFRMNKPGEMPAIWRCKKCMTQAQFSKVDPVVMDITDAIQNRNTI